MGTGGDSVAVYENWRALNTQGKEGDTWQTSKILNDIRDYNIDDCDSTQELVDWLREQQQVHNIAYIEKTEEILSEKDVKKAKTREELILRRINLRNTLLEKAETLKEE